MADTFFESSWGGVRLWISNIATDRGRTQVVHEPSQGNEYTIQDRGSVLRVARVDLLFDEMDGDPMSPRERLTAFNAIVDGGQPQLFTHPVEGSYVAVISDYEHTVDENGVISGRCTFLQTSDVEPVEAVGAGGSQPTGDNAVAAAADAADAELQAVGLSSETPATARTQVTGWGDNEAQSRQVFAETEALTRRIGDDIIALSLEFDLQLWPAYMAMITLADSVRAAADSFTSEVARVFTVRINHPVPLRALLAEIYGANEVDDRYRQVTGMNDVLNPALLPAGATYMFPARPAQPRRA